LLIRILLARLISCAHRIAASLAGSTASKPLASARFDILLEHAGQRIGAREFQVADQHHVRLQLAHARVEGLGLVVQDQLDPGYATPSITRRTCSARSSTLPVTRV
jgi:hypothetical protein